MSKMLELKGFDEWEKKVNATLKDFPELKKKELQRIGRIYQAEVKQNCPVDTGSLRASITVQLKDEDSVIVGTNKEYVKFVEEGHNQKERFVPGYWREKGGFQYDPQAKGGMMLTNRYVKGKHFFRKSLETAKPKILHEIREFMQVINRKIGG